MHSRGFRMARMSTFLRSLIHFRWVTTKEYDRIMAVRRFWFDLFEKLHFSYEKVNFNLKNFDLFHTGIKNIDGSLYKIASNCLNVFYYVLYIAFQAYLFALQKKEYFFHAISLHNFQAYFYSILGQKKREKEFFTGLMCDCDDHSYPFKTQQTKNLFEEVWNRWVKSKTKRHSQTLEFALFII